MVKIGTAHVDAALEELNLEVKEEDGRWELVAVSDDS